MTITAEVLEEVAEYVQCLDLDATARDLRKVAGRIHDRELLDGPDRALASALRTAYYDDGELYDAKYSSVPGQWLRMAAAAREHVNAEARARFNAEVEDSSDEPSGPRVFNVGDDVPADYESITLKGTINDRVNWRGFGSEVILSFGKHGLSGASQWFAVNQEHPTSGPWDYWLAESGPLTEVLP